MIPTKSNRRGYSGYTDDELTSRLSAVLEDTAIGQQIQKEYEEKHPKTFSAPENWTDSEYANYNKTNKFIADNPLSNLSNDKKFEVMQAQYQKDLVEDTKQRVQASEIIEGKIQSQLKSMGIDPNSYEYSVEYERLTEGGDLD